jgi:hypothetical protein
LFWPSLAHELTGETTGAFPGNEALPLQQFQERIVLAEAGADKYVKDGGAAASAVTDDSEGVGAGAALLPLVGAGIGALVGLAFGGRQKRVLIYQSR